MSEELNEAFGKALKIMVEAEETINSVTPAERKKCNEIVQKYIGEPAEEYGFRKSRFDRPKDMVHEWIFERTVDAIRQSIVIREQPLAKGELKLSCGGGIKPIKTNVIYDNTMEGFEKAVLELKKYMDSVGYVNLEEKIKSDDRITSADYEDLFYNYKLYAEKFMAENNLSEESSVSDRLMMIERVLERCHERGKSFVNNKKDLMQAAGCLATIISDIPGAEWKISEDKADCYFTREPAGHYRLIFSVTGTILFYLENGLDGDSLVELMEDIYTDEEYDEFIENIQRK